MIISTLHNVTSLIVAMVKCSPFAGDCGEGSVVGIMWNVVAQCNTREAKVLQWHALITDTSIFKMSYILKKAH